MRKIIFILILGCVILINACQTPFSNQGSSPIPTPILPPTPAADEILLPFTLLYDDQGGGSHSIQQPELIMINLSSEISQTERIILHRSAHKKIQAVDFKQYFVLIVFQGHKTSGGYKVLIKQVTKRDQTLFVYTELWKPYKGQIVTANTPSPYQVIQVPRQDDLPQEPTLVLRDWVVIWPTPKYQ